MTGFHVSNEPELFGALRQAKQGDRIWIYGHQGTRDYEIHIWCVVAAVASVVYVMIVTFTVLFFMGVKKINNEEEDR